MVELELNRLVESWVAGQEAEDGTPEHERNWWAISQVMDGLLRAKQIGSGFSFSLPISAIFPTE
jgi:hypothetical protein